MRVDVTPLRSSVMPGQPTMLTVNVFNTSEVISSHHIRVLGVDARWLSIDREDLALFPGESGVALITVTLPPGIPAGTRRLVVQVRESTSGGDMQTVEVDLTVAARQNTTLELNPVTVTGGRRGEVALTVANAGNDTIDVSFDGSDGEEKVRFEFVPGAVRLAPGEERTTRVRMKGRRPLTGSPRIRMVTLRAVERDSVMETLGSFIQKPRLSRGMLGLVGLLVAITVFAGVITYTFGRVVSTSTTDKAVLLQVIEAGKAKNGQSAGSIAGKVTLLTSGAGKGSVTVQAFESSNIGTAIATTATAPDGTYKLENLNPAAYKLRFNGAGFTELWYPASPTPDGSAPVQVAAKQAVAAIDVQLGGIPAEITGKVITAKPIDAAGATVNLRRRGGAPSGGAVAVAPITTAPTGPVVDDLSVGADAGAIVQSVITDASGVFKLVGIPSPNTYELEASKTGYATARQEIILRTADNLSDVTLQLRKGDGSITGSIASADGPVEGATITASDGISTFSTKSLTVDPKGDFKLLDLPTPATYSVVVSQPGFATQTLSVSLAPAQQASGLLVTVVPGEGSIAGHVTADTDQAGVQELQGGVTVTVADGKTTRTTVTLSDGDVGSFTMVGLALPATYTITFSRPDLLSQTRSVALDPLAPDRVNATGVDVVMRTATASLFGVVQQAEDNVADPAVTTLQPVPEVTVVLTSGPNTFRTTTVQRPVKGYYELDGLPAGTYSVSFSRTGSFPTNTLVTLSPGDRTELPATIERQASISGRVVSATTGAPLSGAQVTLYTVNGFPNTPLKTVTTDAAGRYTFVPVDAPVTYVVAFSNPAGTPAQSSLTVPRTAGQTTPVPDVALTG